MTRFERVFVWLGGALFVASLSVGAWWYVFHLARWTPPSGWRPLASDALLFAAFAAHHSAFARERVKAGLSRLLPQRLLRSVYVWTASLLLMLVVGLWQRVGGDVYTSTGWRALAHAGVQLAGLWLIVRSVGAIDPLELAGIRQSTAREGLQVEGPYHLVRHPLYLGWMLIVFGAAHMTGDRLTFAVITSFYLVVAIPWEERSLARSFGDEYERYRARIRWRVIPYVY